MIYIFVTLETWKYLWTGWRTSWWLESNFL